jgi:hypothetical protein
LLRREGIDFFRVPVFGKKHDQSSVASFSHSTVWPPSYQMAAVFPPRGFLFRYPLKEWICRMSSLFGRTTSLPAGVRSRPLERFVELSRYRGRIFPSPFMANIET